jgi:hypothetical protein
LYQQRIATSDLAQALNLRQLLDVVHPMNPPRFSSFLNTHFPVGVLRGRPAMSKRIILPSDGVQRRRTKEQP